MNDAPDFLVHWPDPDDESDAVDDVGPTSTRGSSTTESEQVSESEEPPTSTPVAAPAEAHGASTGASLRGDTGPRRSLGRVRLRLGSRRADVPTDTTSGSGGDDEVEQLRRRLAEVEAELRQTRAR